MRTSGTVRLMGGVACVAAWFQACMPASLEVGRGFGEAGDTGNTQIDGEGGGAGDGVAAQGGSGSVDAGRGGGAGRGGNGSGARSSGGRDAGGAGKSSAGRPGVNGGSAGSLEGVGGNAQGGAGSGGSSGSGGIDAGGGSVTSPNGLCRCRFYENFDFTCDMDVDVMASRVTIPFACSEEVLDLTGATRSSCGLSTEYRWDVGEENVYVVTLDAEGEPVYLAAFGYVGGLCGLSVEGAHDGEVQAGVKPDEACGQECSFCGFVPHEGEAPTSNCDGTCLIDPERPEVALQPLDEFCEDNGCSTTLEKARVNLPRACTPPAYSRIVTGCDFVRVEWGDMLWGRALYFDEESGALVGAEIRSDFEYGACMTIGYRGGIAPPESCETETTCDYCSGGEAGAGGANDGVVVCTP